MWGITTTRLVPVQTKPPIYRGGINGYPCDHAYPSLSGSPDDQQGAVLRACATYLT